jgi:hypothetical protein
MFGLSKAERAEKALVVIQRRIFERSLDNANGYSPHTRLAVFEEILAFYLHCLSRYTFREGQENLRDYLAGSTVLAMTDIASSVARDMKKEAFPGIEAEIRALFDEREREYAELKKQMPESADDPDNVGVRAAKHIARAAQAPLDNRMREGIVRDLFHGTIEMDLFRKTNEVARLLGIAELTVAEGAIKPRV